jgi:hypothetical protein
MNGLRLRGPEEIIHKRDRYSFRADDQHPCELPQEWAGRRVGLAGRAYLPDVLYIYAREYHPKVKPLPLP